jgi:hypothetical protein
MPGTAIPAELRQLIVTVSAQLLSGETADHQVLLDQLALAEIDKVEFTGVGLFASFACPASVRRISAGRAIGGSATIEIDGLECGADSLICVTNGVIDFLEIYTMGGERWPAEIDSASTVLLVPLPITYD